MAIAHHLRQGEGEEADEETAKSGAQPVWQAAAVLEEAPAKVIDADVGERDEAAEEAEQGVGQQFPCASKGADRR